MNPEVLTRLASVQIKVVAEHNGYFVLAREGCLGIVLRQTAGLSIGSSGMMTDSGLAYLVWRDGAPLLASHGGSTTPATSEQVSTIRLFSNDLKAAISE